MRLEVGSFHINSIEYGVRTGVDWRDLVVNGEEVRRLVLGDSHFADVRVHLARPGETIRIINAKDAVEPRWKVAGPGGVFPGFVSAPTTVGEGRTHRLGGVAVLEVAEPVPGEQTHFREQILDMSGPGAEFSPFAQTLNVAIEFTPHPSLFPSASVDAKDVLGGTSEAEDYNRATTLACLKVAAYLARATAEQLPDEVETFELTPCRARAAPGGVPVPQPSGVRVRREDPAAAGDTHPPQRGVRRGPSRLAPGVSRDVLGPEQPGHAGAVSGARQER